MDRLSFLQEPDDGLSKSNSSSLISLTGEDLFDSLMDVANSLENEIDREGINDMQYESDEVVTDTDLDITKCNLSEHTTDYPEIVVDLESLTSGDCKHSEQSELIDIKSKNNVNSTENLHGMIPVTNIDLNEDIINNGPSTNENDELEVNDNTENNITNNTYSISSSCVDEEPGGIALNQEPTPNPKTVNTDHETDISKSNFDMSAEVKHASDKPSIEQQKFTSAEINDVNVEGDEAIQERQRNNQSKKLMTSESTDSRAIPVTLSNSPLLRPRELSNASSIDTDSELNEAIGRKYITSNKGTCQNNSSSFNNQESHDTDSDLCEHLKDKQLIGSDCIHKSAEQRPTVYESVPRTISNANEDISENEIHSNGDLKSIEDEGEKTQAVCEDDMQNSILTIKKARENDDDNLDLKTRIDNGVENSKKTTVWYAEDGSDTVDNTSADDTLHNKAVLGEKEGDNADSNISVESKFQAVEETIKDMYYEGEKRHSSACYSTSPIRRCMDAIDDLSREKRQQLSDKNLNGTESPITEEELSVNSDGDSHYSEDALSIGSNRTPENLRKKLILPKISQELSRSSSKSSCSDFDFSEDGTARSCSSRTSSKDGQDDENAMDYLNCEHFTPNRSRGGSVVSTNSEIVFQEEYAANKLATSQSLDRDRPVVHSGYLIKLGGSGITPKNWRRRWFILRKDNCLYYYKTPKVNENISSTNCSGNSLDKDPYGAVVLSNYLIMKASDVNKKHAFRLTKGGARTYNFAATSDQDMRTWMRVLSEAARAGSNDELTPECSLHNVSIPALSIKDPDCHGYLWKQGHNHKSWKRRYCVLKYGCLYYYQDMSETIALGVFKMHGHSIQETELPNRKYNFIAIPPDPSMRTFYFSTETDTDLIRWVSAMRKSIDNVRKDVE